MRAAFSASYLLLVGGKDDGFDLPCCDIVQCHNHIVELSQVCFHGQVVGFELGLHLPEPHLRMRGPKWWQLEEMDETLTGSAE